MFDFSLGKLFLLALVALLVLGPDKLPGAARTVGALVRRLRSGWDNVRAEVERELEIEEIRQAARKAAAEAEATQAEASETLNRLREEMDKARAQARDLAGGDDASDEAEAAQTHVADTSEPATGVSAAKESDGQR